MNASVTGSALNQIPLVNSTQLLTASAQQPMTSVLGSTPIVASGVAGTVPVTTGTVPVVTGTIPVASTVPLGSTVAAGTLPVNSVLGASSVQPLATPLAASGVVQTTPLVASSVQPLPPTSLVGSVPLQQPVVTPTLPVPTAGHFGTISNAVPDDDYRLGRGILDDFRPTSYKTIISSTPSLVATTTTPALVTTTTPALSVTTPGVVGTSNIKDFL